MAQLPNQFTQAAVKGMMDLRINPNIVSCQMDSSSAGGIIAGQAVKIVDSAGGIPKVVECAADSDDVFGFVVYNIRKATFAALDAVEIAVNRGNVMYMEASAAIARGAKVMILVTGSKVLTATGATKMIVGRAYDKAVNAGDLIRVTIDLPGRTVGSNNLVQAATVAANATAVATDLPTAIALANSLQTTVNAILVSIKAAGLMA